MRTIKTILILSPFLFLVHACASGQRSKTSVKPHYENLTDNRLKFPAVIDSILKIEDEPDVAFLPPEHAVTEQVNTVLDSIARFNRERLFVDGYTIQIYSGVKRDEAMSAKKRVIDIFKEVVTDIHYQQPKWILKTGSYYTRLDAQRDLRKLKQIFPTAILVPEKVALK
jgi:hypothetical protein